MKIVMIRHAAVEYVWEKEYNSREYDEACRGYETSGIQTTHPEKLDPRGRRVYVSTAGRTQETAKLLFGDCGQVVTPLLDEVPLRSYRDTGQRYPLWLWNVRGRLQWFTGNPRQEESRRATHERARKLITELRQQGEDCILVSHGWFLNVLSAELKAAGYHIRRGSVFHISPQERILATEKEMHCGHCRHNCLLTNPGCMIGEEKARNAGIRYKKR